MVSPFAAEYTGNLTEEDQLRKALELSMCDVSGHVPSSEPISDERPRCTTRTGSNESSGTTSCTPPRDDLVLDEIMRSHSSHKRRSSSSLNTHVLFLSSDDDADTGSDVKRSVVKKPAVDGRVRVERP